MNQIDIRFYAPNLEILDIPDEGKCHPVLFNALAVANNQTDPKIEIRTYQVGFEWIDMVANPDYDPPIDTLIEGSVQIFYADFGISLLHQYFSPDKNGCYLVISGEPTEICSWLVTEHDNWFQLLSTLCNLFIAPDGFCWFDDEMILDVISDNVSFSDPNALAWANVYGNNMYNQFSTAFRTRLESNAVLMDIPNIGKAVPCFQPGPVTPHTSENYGAQEYQISHTLNGASVRGIVGPNSVESLTVQEQSAQTGVPGLLQRNKMRLNYWTTRRRMRKAGFGDLIDNTWPEWPKFPKTKE